MNGQDLLQGLKICKSETQLGSAQSVLKKKEKLRVLLVKKYILGKNQSCIFNPWIGQRW